MNTLTIDTSNHILGVSIIQEDQVVGEMVTNLVKNQTTRLMPAIKQLFDKVAMTPDKLDQIVVAQGPGSFTGIRVGLTTAKSLAWALDIPVIGVSSLEVLAYQGRFFHSYISPFFDARRQRVFTSLYQWQNNELVMVEDEQNISMEVWLKKLALNKQDILFLSPNITMYEDMIIDQLGDLAIIPKMPYHITRPSHVALSGINKEPDNTHTITPHYLRLAEAEANWLKEQNKNG